LLLLAALTATALAAPCPLDRTTPARPSATITSVTVHGETLGVRGREACPVVADTLRDCGYAGAAVQLREWRRMRRWTNACLATSFLGVPLLLSAIPAVAAGERRDEMVRELGGTPGRALSRETLDIPVD
jgi:hypothetical protein